MTSLIYNTGAVALTNGSATVTGSGTGWAVALVTGGLFSCAGMAIPIASVESDTSLTLAYAWTGGDATGAAYAIVRDTSEATRAAWTNDRLATIIQKLSLVGIHPDGSGTLTERDALDPAPSVGYLWLYVESGHDLAFYRKTASGWDGPFDVRGTVGDPGGSGAAATVAVGDVDTVAPGAPATVTNSGTPSAAVLNFEIPQGAAATIAVGTVTTGAAGTDADVANSGTTGAAVLDFTIPRGDKGDVYETYDASIYKSDGITVGGYYLDRRASMANVQDTIYAEIIDGDTGAEIDMYLEVAGAAAYGPFTVAVGTPVSVSSLTIAIAADDSVNLVLTAIIGGAVRDFYFKSHGAAA